MTAPKQIRRIRGHHLVDLANYLFEPKKTRQKYLKDGYGEKWVENMTQIFQDFFKGKIRIEIVAGCLDDLCLADCLYRHKPRQLFEFPCEDPSCKTPNRMGFLYDSEHAGYFLLKIGGKYSFRQIERNLRAFYAGQHSM